MQPRLASNLCGRMTLDSSCSCSHFLVLGLHACPATPSLFRAGARARGIMYARQGLCQLSFVSGPVFLDLSSVVACGVKWDLASSSLGWPVVLAVFVEYLAPRALMEYHL